MTTKTIAGLIFLGLLLGTVTKNKGAAAMGSTVVIVNGSVGSYTDQFSRGMHSAFNSQLGNLLTLIKISEEPTVFTKKKMSKYNAKEISRIINKDFAAAGGRRFKSVITKQSDKFRKANFLVLILEIKNKGIPDNFFPLLRRWLYHEEKRVSVVLIDTGRAQKSRTVTNKFNNVAGGAQGSSAPRFLLLKPPSPSLRGGAPAKASVNAAVCWAFPAKLRPMFDCGQGRKIYSLGVAIDRGIGMSNARRRALTRRFSPTIAPSGIPVTLHTELTPATEALKTMNKSGSGTFDFLFHVKRSNRGAVYHRPTIRDLSDRTRGIISPPKLINGYEDLARWIETEIVSNVRRRIGRSIAPKLEERVLKLMDAKGIPVPDNTIIEVDSHFGGPGWARNPEQKSSDGLVRLLLPRGALYHRLMIKDNRKRHVALLTHETIPKLTKGGVTLENISFREVTLTRVESQTRQMKGTGVKYFVYDDLEKQIFSKHTKKALVISLLKKRYLWFAVPDDPDYKAAVGLLESDGVQSEVLTEFELDPLTKRKSRANMRRFFTRGRLNAAGKESLALSANFLVALIEHTSNEFRRFKRITKDSRAWWKQVVQEMILPGMYRRLERTMQRARFGSTGEPLPAAVKRFRTFSRVMQFGNTGVVSSRDKENLRFWVNAAKRPLAGKTLISKAFGQHILNK